MVEIVGRSETLEKASEDLIEAAKTGGSDDNITCLLIRMVEQSRAERMLDALLPGRSRHKWQDSV